MGLAQNGFDFWELLAIFIVVGGPTKALAMFIPAAGRLPVAERVAIAVKAIGTSAFILLIFAFLGQQIINFFHVSVPALEMAGGIILFAFALGLVLGSNHEDHYSADDPHAIAIYPLAVPLIASPQAIVAVVLVMSPLPTLQDKLPAMAALVAVILLDAAVLVGAAYIMKGGQGEKKSGFADVFLRVVAILLCALATELFVRGLRDLGVIERAAGH